MQRSICVFQTEAGEGHRNAERVIRKAMGDSAAIDSFETYRDVLAGYDVAAKYLGISSPELYNKLVLQKGRTGVTWTVLAGLNLAYLKIMKGRLARRVAEFVSHRHCDMAVTLVPLLGSVLTEGVKRANKNIPVITVATDFTEPVKGVWFQDERQIVIVCTPEAEQQALGAGIPRDQVHLLSGAPIDTEALDPATADAAEIKKHLSGVKPVVLLLFGGHAGQVVESYMEAMEASSVDADVVCVCGRNESLRERLAARGFGKLKLATGFVDIAPYYAAADLVVGKPGPGVIAEAAHMNAPLLLEFNRATMAQERFNAGWAKRRGIAETFSSTGELIERLQLMLEPGRLAAYQARTREIQNNSMAEIKDILSRYLAV